jgi:TolB-like protein/lipoprotein NlpI
MSIRHSGPVAGLHPCFSAARGATFVSDTPIPRTATTLIEPLQRLKERKVARWGLAYLAAGWVLLQVLNLLATTYAWPSSVTRSLPVLVAAGFFVTVVLAWYHGERGRQRVGGAEVVVLAVIALATAGGLRWAHAGRSVADRVAEGATAQTVAVDPRSVAVLPFRDPGGAEGEEYFGAGIAEEILDELAQVPGLRVAARTSSFHFGGRDVPASEIARQLGVATVLEGSVRRDGDRVRVSARLVDATDRQLWARTFDGHAADVFGVQMEIARTVAQALRAQLAPERSQATPDAAAHDLYLQGLFHWNRRGVVHVRRAIDLFDEAVRLEPGYARAHAGLGLAWAVIHHNAPHVRAEDALARAEVAARRALELDPTLPDAHAALGYTYVWLWRWDDARHELEQAVALNPNHSRSRQWYGELLVQLGLSAEGESQLRQAVALDPLSPVAHGNLGLVLLLSGRVPEAIAQLEATQRMDPALGFPLLLLHRAYLLTGRYDEARTAGRRFAELDATREPVDVEALVSAVADPDQRNSGRTVLERWRRAARPDWIDIAFYHVMLDDHDAAFDALERALAQRAPMLSTLRVSPIWGALHGDPRFQRILEAIS